MKLIKVITVHDQVMLVVARRLTEFIAYWQEKIKLIPEEYRDDAIIVIDMEDYHDNSQLRITIYYEMEETDQEEDDRLKRRGEQGLVLESINEEGG